MRRVIGRLTQVLLVVVAATLVVQVGVALGVARTSKPVVFVPFPAGAAQATQTRQVSDSAQVRAAGDTSDRHAPKRLISS